MKSSTISFKPLQENDLELLCKWLDMPHVKEWWNDGLNHDEIKEKYRKRIGDTIVVPFIVYLDNKPIGFIHTVNYNIQFIIVYFLKLLFFNPSEISCESLISFDFCCIRK